MFVGPRGRMGLARLMQARIYMITQIATTLFSLIALDLFYATTDKVTVASAPHRNISVDALALLDRRTTSTVTSA